MGSEVSAVQMWFKRQTHSTIMQSKVLSSHGSDEDLHHGSSHQQLRQIFGQARGISPVPSDAGKRLQRKKVMRSDSSFIGGSFTDSILDLQGLIDDKEDKEVMFTLSSFFLLQRFFSVGHGTHCR